jgi:putative glutamine amidotransferase
MATNRVPSIVVTLADPSRHSNPDLARRRNELYLDRVARHGGKPIPIDGSTDREARASAFATMDGLLLSGGADIEPARYGRPNKDSLEVERDRDELEAQAWAAAESRGVPVLGICRGFQAINVFSGGTLLQHVDDHAGPAWSTGPARQHPIRLEAAGGLAAIVAADLPPDGTVIVNTYHHQAVTAADLAPGLVATAWADSPAGELVEALELPGERFVVGVQCHPERTESTPAAFERLWQSFIEASAREPLPDV